MALFLFFITSSTLTLSSHLIWDRPRVTNDAVNSPAGSRFHHLYCHFELAKLLLVTSAHKKRLGQDMQHEAQIYHPIASAGPHGVQ